MPKLNAAQTQQLFADLEIKSLSEITGEWVGQFLQKVAGNPAKQAAWALLLECVKEVNPEFYKKLIAVGNANKGMLLELQGAEPWHKRLGALTFTRPFAPIQKRFLDWNWNALMKVRRNIELEPEEYVGFLPWPRETGKSSIVEWACIAEGAILRNGYVIYLSGKQAQAEDHVVAIRDRIEKEHVAELYPWLSKPKMGAHSNKFGWGREFLMTHGGWAIRPIGADVAIRGGKRLDLRVTLIVVDDYDELGDSPVVVEHKKNMVTRSILPMGNNKTRVLVPQNPIHENSCINQMLTGASLALAIRTVFGEIEPDGSLSERPIPAIKDFAYEVRQEDKGPYSVITKGESNWPGISIENWQTTLNRVSPDAFGAEYQHDLSIAKEEKVLPEYDDRVLMAHLITIDQFEAMYGHRRIPSDWPADLGVDIGYTTGHKSAWTFLTKVPQGIKLAGSIFRYRGISFTNTSIDDQSIAVRAKMWPDEQIEREYISHEKLGERLVLNGKHDWHFVSMPDSGKQAGLSEWRHHLRCDHTKPHPFHRDEKINGLWKIGRPAWFDIVMDSQQFRSPRDDNGLKRHRDGAFNWRKVPVKLTEKGITVEQPAKVDDDENDSTRCLLAGGSFGPADQPMTLAQKRDALIPQGYHDAELAARTDISPDQKAMTGYLANYLANKTMKTKLPKPRDEFGQPLR